MRRRICVLASVVVMLALFLAAIPVCAASEVRVTVNGEDYETLTVSDGKVTLPPAPEGLSEAFVGWCVTENGKDKIYPPSATVTAIAGALYRAETAAFLTESRAQMRIYDGDVAVRYVSTLHKSSYLRLTDLFGEKGLSFGTLITVIEYMYQTDFELTEEALREAGDLPYLDIPTAGWYTETSTEFTIAGSIGHIREENYSRTYVGRGYIDVTYSDGTEGRIYSPFTAEASENSLYHAIQRAYGDRSHSYAYGVPIGMHGSTFNTHSPYTLAQLDRMKAVLDSVAVIVQSTDGEGESVYSGYSQKYYTAPYTVSYATDESSDGDYTITITAAEGSSISAIKGIMLLGSRIAMGSSRVEVGESTVTVIHSDYTDDY